METVADGWLLGGVKVVAMAFVTNWVRYVLVAGSLYVLLYKVLPSKADAHRAPLAPPDARQMWREFSLSTVSCFIFALSAFAIYTFMSMGLIHVYFDWREHGLIYLPISLIIMIVLFDAYFYFTHRMLHLVGVKRSTHDRHHASVLPTPWAALSFSVPEALVIGAFFFLITVVMPIQFNVYHTFLLIVFVQSALHHSSYVSVPVKWMEWPVVRRFPIRS